MTFLRPAGRPGLRVAVAAALVAGLAACGGGDDGPATATDGGTATAVPDRALASITAFKDYLAGLVTGDETADALALATGAPPTSETDEPAPLR